MLEDVIDNMEEKEIEEGHVRLVKAINNFIEKKLI